MSRRVTIEDIAQHSNVSRTTVSLVLRNKPGIGVETRERVLAAARDLGYQRHLQAAIEPGQAALNVGLVVRTRTRYRESLTPHINPFYSWVLTGIEAAAVGQRMNLLFATMPVDDHNRPLVFPDHLLAQALDGILLIGSFGGPVVSEIARRQPAPIVLVDGPAEPHSVDTIASDNQGGTAAAVRYLVSRGHRRIALFGPDAASDPNFAQRRAGYLQAMGEAGLEPITPDVVLEDAATATVALLTDHPDLTALVGSNDAHAIAAMRAAQEAGRRVPEDLSVVGFDDIELSAQVSPALTTMAVDKVSMGRLAVQTLAYRLAWPDAAVSLTTMLPAVLERRSVADVGARVAGTVGDPRTEE